MFNKLSILIPYQPDNGPRDVNLKWIQKYYRLVMPGVEICIGKSTEKLFNRSHAVNSAAKKATRDIFVIADGDIFYDPAMLTDSLKCLKKASWIIPFLTIVKLSESNTKKLLQTTPSWPTKAEITDFQTIRPSKNSYLGHLNIISRQNFMAVRGFDERFAGWGGEDDAFACAVNTLCGKFTRLNHTVYHLWHPHVGYQKNPNADNNRSLRKLYYKADGNKEKMKELLVKK